MNNKIIRISETEQVILSHYPTLVSTNETAVAAAKKGAPSWSVISASEQSGGKGRHNREWVSPPNMGLWLSVILRPKIEARRLSLLNLTISLAIREFLEDQFKSANMDAYCKCMVKWPNDVWVNNKKICGVLLDASITENKIDYLIVGMGVNVNQDCADFPEDLLYRATSLRCETGSIWPMVDLRIYLLRKLHHYIDKYSAKNFDGVVDVYLKHMLFKNRDVEIRIDDRALSGTILGIDRDGYLRLLGDAGETRVTAGDVFPQKRGA